MPNDAFDLKGRLTIDMYVTGVKIFVDPKAVMYLLGCRMDYVVSLMHQVVFGYFELFRGHL